MESGTAERPVAQGLEATGSSPAHPAPGPDDIQPATNETRDRIITGIITVVPSSRCGFAVWQAWMGCCGRATSPSSWSSTSQPALGVTVGFHRLLTHRSFKTTPAVRGTLAALGSAAIEGPVISWVADHRKHHAFADKPGDPHSPHVDHGGGWRGALRGLAPRALRLAVHPHPARRAGRATRPT